MLKFRLNCIPTAQARARHGRTKSGLHVTFKSANQRANERTLEALLAPHAPKQPLSGPLVLEFVAALPVGKSDSKRLREAKLAGFVAPEKKPDTDNLLKQMLDACTRLQFWADDCQVVKIVGEKIYAETGYWEVAIYEAVRRPEGVAA